MTETRQRSTTVWSSREGKKTKLQKSVHQHGTCPGIASKTEAMLKKSTRRQRPALKPFQSQRFVTKQKRVAVSYLGLLTGPTRESKY